MASVSPLGCLLGISGDSSYNAVTGTRFTQPSGIPTDKTRQNMCNTKDSFQDTACQTTGTVASERWVTEGTPPWPQLSAWRVSTCSTEGSLKQSLRDPELRRWS